ncbi:hypothetical protein NM688_g837 [Phlebia brevispora]|uniref:Uncharacterized protein n=1 Tax=Phlebia brevispora TaxID=194682 RepID=A0ACC1TDG0_9APHY|nr:hypothetical protein NM688_g837 [Phlebia brevispora]
MSKKIRVFVELPPEPGESRSVRHLIPMQPSDTVGDLAATISRRQSFASDLSRRMSLSLENDALLSSEDTLEDVLDSYGEVIRVAFSDPGRDTAPVTSTLSPSNSVSAAGTTSLAVNTPSSKGSEPSAQKSQTQLMRYQNHWPYPLDIMTIEIYPERKPHARLEETVVSARMAAARQIVPWSTQRQKRLMQEVREVVNKPHPAFDVYTGDDLAFWKVVIEAPKRSPYEGGTFLAYIDFVEDYPRVAPEIHFVTRILHPNINKHGRGCHAAFDRSWLVDTSTSVIFQIIYGMLLTPDVDNPLDLHATMEYNDDTGQHALKVHEMVQTFAWKTREEWRIELEQSLASNEDRIDRP